MRAIGDGQLTGLHWHVLAVVAAYDQFGKNGYGCFKPPKEMAQEVGCHHTNFSTAMRELMRWGYVTAERTKRDRRRWSYRVIYREEIVCAKANNPAAEQEDEIGDCLSTGKGNGEIVCPEKQQVVDNNAQPRHKINTDKISCSEQVPRARVREVIGLASDALSSTKPSRTKGFAEKNAAEQPQGVIPLVIEGGKGSTAANTVAALSDRSMATAGPPVRKLPDMLRDGYPEIYAKYEPDGDQPGPKTVEDWLKTG